jgi:histidinol-phosphate aminotransferase
LERVRPPFNVNLVAQSAGVAALADRARLKLTVGRVMAERKKLERALDTRGVRRIPSVANFILIDVAPLKGKAVFERLLRKGVIVRSVDEYGLHNYIRVTVGRPDENRFFLKAFDETRGELKP